MSFNLLEKQDNSQNTYADNAKVKSGKIHRTQNFRTGCRYWQLFIHGSAHGCSALICFAADQRA